MRGENRRNHLPNINEAMPRNRRCRDTRVWRYPICGGMEVYVGNLKAVILDIDGTLVLSNDAHALAYAEAAAALGIKSDFNKIRRLIGKGGDKLIPEAFGFELETDLGRKLDEL